ncbi:MAG: hypothetical protein R6X25_04785 [Candidatus Krumholzibacteriia bacterium]
MRRLVPQLIVSVLGLLLVLTSFAAKPHEVTDPAAPARFLAYLDRNVSVWFNVLAVFAFVLGGGNLVKNHVARVVRRDRDWMYSVVALVAFTVVLALGLLKVGGAPGLQGDPTDPASAFGWIFSAIYAPLMATLFSLLAFFVASAAYRAFRMRTPEATILLLSAFVVLVGRTPLAQLVGGWLPAPLAFLRPEFLSLWLMRVPNVAGQRAILIGIALGVVAASLRLLLGLERRGPGGGGGRT